VPHGFVGDVEPSFGKQFLDIAVAQGEAAIELDRVLDDLRWEAMAAVAERSYADILPDTPLAPDPVFLTMPMSIWIGQRDLPTRHGLNDLLLQSRVNSIG